MITWLAVLEGRGLWHGTMENRREIGAVIALSVAPSYFEVQVRMNGYIVHSSQHDCLCQAKADAETAIARTLRIHTTEVQA